MRMNDAVTGGVFVLLSALILFAARGFPTLPDQPYGPGTFPTIIAAVMMEDDERFRNFAQMEIDRFKAKGKKTFLLERARDAKDIQLLAGKHK